MKSQKHPAEPTENKIEFPILMEYQDRDFVVLFSSEREGTVVNSSFETYPVGHYDNYWNSSYSSEWHPYEGSIVLSN